MTFRHVYATVMAGMSEPALCRFAKVFTSADPLNNAPISQLGKDSYTELPDEEAFCKLMASQRRSIKAVLLDQGVLCGIGNWVADEVLYQAKLYPEKSARDLEEAEMKLLRTCIKDVLAQAVEVDADATRLPREWLFHYRCACSFFLSCRSYRSFLWEDFTVIGVSG
jgi:formamidopyrimidine-DNA glycosylase